MKCKKIQKLISKFFDDQLKNPQDELLIFSHIKECKRCSLFFNLLEKLYNISKLSYEKVEPTEFFNTKLLSRITMSEQPTILPKTLRAKNVLVPVLTTLMVIISSLFIPRYCKQKPEVYSYELYPEEDIDLATFDILLVNGLTTEFNTKEQEI